MLLFIPSGSLFVFHEVMGLDSSFQAVVCDMLVFPHVMESEREMKGKGFLASGVGTLTPTPSHLLHDNLLINFWVLQIT